MFLCLLTFSCSLFAETATPTPVPQAYKKGETPQWAKDLRRAEIITLGSIPFVTIWTMLAYSAITKGKIVNPLSKDSSDSFDEADQGRILGIACSVSLALGLTDFTINLIQRMIEKNKASKEINENAITVVPLDGIETLIETEAVIPDYLRGGLESVVF